MTAYRLVLALLLLAGLALAGAACVIAARADMRTAQLHTCDINAERECTVCDLDADYCKQEGFTK